MTGYWEWVLGDVRSKSLLHVQTEVDPRSGALLARNPYSAEFSERIAFVDVNDPAFWELGLQLLGDMVGEAERLAK